MWTRSSAKANMNTDWEKKKKKVPEFAVLFFVVVWVMSYTFISCEADHPPKVPVKEVTEIWSCPLLVFG